MGLNIVEEFLVPARLRVLAARDFVVAEVGRVVLETGARLAKLRRRVGAFGRRGCIGRSIIRGELHGSAAAVAASRVLLGALAVVADLLPFGCGRTGALCIHW